MPFLVLRFPDRLSHFNWPKCCDISRSSQRVLTLRKQNLLLGEKCVPFCCGNVLGEAADEHDDVTVAGESLAVVAQSLVVPEERQTRIIVGSQILDVMPAAGVAVEEFAAIQNGLRGGFGARLAAQKLRVSMWVAGVDQAEGRLGRCLPAGKFLPWPSA